MTSPAPRICAATCCTWTSTRSTRTTCQRWTAPPRGGLEPDELIDLLAALAPAAVGAQITVFDPDLDPDGRYARLLTEVIGIGLQDLGAQRSPG